MQESISAAEQKLLLPADLSLPQVQQALAEAADGLDWADVYIEHSMQESWHLEESIVKSGHFSDDSGIGLRAVCGETTAYASSDIIAPAIFSHLKDTARVAKTYGGAFAGKVATVSCPPPRFGAHSASINDVDKIALLKQADTLCRRHTQIENVIVTLARNISTVLIVRMDGSVAADYRPMLRFNLQVIMRDANGKRESGNAGGGGRCGYEWLSPERVAAFCQQAVEDAAAKLQAQEAPVGKMPVVLGPGWAGVLLHEAVGHGLEGDFNRKKLSAFSGKIGEKIAAAGITVVDAGNIDGRRGSLSVDDEGTPTQETVLIENGKLCGYMQDIVNARLMATAATGNGRRQSYAYPPMPRMTNTYMSAGNYAPEEIIASVKEGIYAEDFNGGEVDITNGNFVFVAAKARRIENGKLGAIVKGATIIGNGPAIMPLISMVGNNFSLDPGVGSCGKDGQWVPVGVGQPTIKIDTLTVGGAGLVAR